MKSIKKTKQKAVAFDATLTLNSPFAAAQIISSLGVDSLTGDYHLDGKILNINGVSQVQANAALKGVNKQAVIAAESKAAFDTRNAKTIADIDALERSIDTPRIRREYAEGARKTLAGLTPTKNETWTLKKVQTVDAQIVALRAKLK